MSSPSTHIRLKLSSLSLVGLCLLLDAGVARAAPCEAEHFQLVETEPAHLLNRAHELAAEQRYARARYVFEVLLERRQEERESRLGLARLDAWEQCYERAEAEYRAWLERLPTDVEARAGLIDVLLWAGHRDEAERELERALQLSPRAPELWQRRVTLYLNRDQPTEALRAAEHGLEIAPEDAQLRALRDRIYFNQLRAYARLDRYSGDYPDLHSVALSYWRRLARFELSLDTLLVERSGGALPKAIIDGQYSAGVSYHFGPPATLGLVFGVGAPSRALPRWIGKAWLSSQWSPSWSTHVSYTGWMFGAEKTVHIISPVLTFTPNDQLSFDARYFGTWLVLNQPGNPERFVSAIGARGVLQLTADWRAGVSYTYGAQLDQASVSEIISLRSHVLALFADYRPGMSWGLQPILSGERRALHDNAVWIVSLELGAYVRW